MTLPTIFSTPTTVRLNPHRAMCRSPSNNGNGNVKAHFWQKIYPSGNYFLDGIWLVTEDTSVPGGSTLSCLLRAFIKPAL